MPNEPPANLPHARQRSAANRNARRREVQRQIAQEVLKEFCQRNPFGGCPDPLDCGYDPLNGCLSATELAKTANTLKIPSVSGKVGRWDATMVRNVMKDYPPEDDP